MPMPMPIPRLNTDHSTPRRISPFAEGRGGGCDDYLRSTSCYVFQARRSVRSTKVRRRSDVIDRPLAKRHDAIYLGIFFGQLYTVFIPRDSYAYRKSDSEGATLLPGNKGTRFTHDGHHIICPFSCAFPFSATFRGTSLPSPKKYVACFWCTLPRISRTIRSLFSFVFNRYKNVNIDQNQKVETQSFSTFNWQELPDSSSDLVARGDSGRRPASLSTGTRIIATTFVQLEQCYVIYFRICTLCCHKRFHRAYRFFNKCR